MNKAAVEAGVPKRVAARSGGARTHTPPQSSLEKSSSFIGMLERRRAAEHQMDDVFEGLPGPADHMPRRVNDELGFILHAWDWSETSLLLDVLTVRYGRVFIVARGARRASSQYRGLLTAFCPLRFSWQGAKEAKMLVRAQWQGTMMPLSGEALMSGFYVNELLLKLTVREERHPGLFEAYVKVLHALALGERDAVQPALRAFELTILKATGWAAVIASNEDALAFTVREGTLVGVNGEADLREGERLWPAASVREMLAGGDMSAKALRASRDILRTLIDFHLEGRSIHSRRILSELNALQKS